MTLYLASCNDPAHHKGKVWNIAVSTKSPFPQLTVKNDKGNNIAIWAPPWPAVKLHKEKMRLLNQDLAKGYIDLEEYNRRARIFNLQYLDQYNNLLKPRRALIEAWARMLNPEEDQTFTCFCSQTWKVAGLVLPRFCHRQLMASWLKRSVDIPVECY